MLSASGVGAGSGARETMLSVAANPDGFSRIRAGQSRLRVLSGDRSSRRQAFTAFPNPLVIAPESKLVFNAALMAEAKKYQIGVAVATRYVAEQSDPAINRHVFAYTITISNTGNVAAQLISRHWIITDAEGHQQEVRGLGVVGHQPLLEPGQSFEYTSGCQLATAVGTMNGSYQMTAEDGVQFEAPIASFVLSMPRVLH